MFDFAWSELALIGVVAMVLIGPKDMPVAIKAVKDIIRKARAMAAEFQTHVDEMVRDADLKDVRDSFNEIRNFDIKGELTKAVDADGSLRAAVDTHLVQPMQDVAALADGAAVEAHAAESGAVEPVATEFLPEPAPLAEIAAPPALPPAFIPPGVAHRAAPPAFMPPGARRPDPTAF